MIKIDNKNIKLWSNIGVRSTFGHALYLIAKKKKNFYVVTGDVSTSAGLDKFRKEFKIIINQEILKVLISTEYFISAVSTNNHFRFAFNLIVN